MWGGENTFPVNYKKVCFDKRHIYLMKRMTIGLSYMYINRTADPPVNRSIPIVPPST